MDSYQNSTEEMMKYNSEILESYKNKFQKVMKIDFDEIEKIIVKLKDIKYDEDSNINVPFYLTDYLDCSKFDSLKNFTIFLYFFIIF
jgi:hypothetical protein